MAMICSGCLNIKSSSFASHPSQTQMQQDTSSQSLTSSRSRSVRPICMYLSRMEIESYMPLSAERLRVSNKKHWTWRWKWRVTVSWPPSSFGARYIWSCQRIRSGDRTCNNLWKCYGRLQDERAYLAVVKNMARVMSSSPAPVHVQRDLTWSAHLGFNARERDIERSPNRYDVEQTYSIAAIAARCLCVQI